MKLVELPLNIKIKLYNFQDSIFICIGTNLKVEIIEMLSFFLLIGVRTTLVYMYMYLRAENNQEFESAWQQGLWQVLGNYGIPEELVILLEDLENIHHLVERDGMEF